MEGGKRATIMVSRETKTRFLKFIGIPKRFENADEALRVLLDKSKSEDGKEHGV